MKNRIIIILMLLAYNCSGQSDFLHFNEAQNIAATEGKLLLLVFSGSDWCKPCIQFKKNVLESSEFSSMKEELLLLYLDFPYKRQNALSKEEKIHNESLAEQYNSDGKFPKIIILNSIGELIHEVEYNKSMTADSFIEEVSNIKN